MALNPFLALNHADPAGDPAAFADLVEAAGDTLHGVHEDPARLAELRALLDRPVPEPLAEPYGPARLRSAVLRLLGRVADAYLLNHPGGPGEHEFAGLVASVAARANALPVLRALALGGARRTQLLGRVGAHDMALQRVLDWGRANGLVAFRAEGEESHYFLTRRGELVVRAVDEPAWLHVAANLAREAVSLRLAGRTAAELAGAALERIAGVTGLTSEAVRRSLDALWRALDPANASRLASALSIVAGEQRGVLLFPPLPDEDRTSGSEASGAYFRSDPQVVLMLALQRAGVLDMECSELSLGHFNVRRRDGDELELPLDRPVISLSLHSAVTQALVTAFGSPVQVHELAVYVLGRATPSGALEQHPAGDAGVIVRLFDAERGVTHVIVGGRGYRARLAASRCFAERFEELLAERPEASFAMLVHPGAQAEPSHVLELDAHPPARPVQTVRWGPPPVVPMPVPVPALVSAAPPVELPDRRVAPRRGADLEAEAATEVEEVPVLVGAGR